MATVMDYEECSQCGGIYYVDYNCRSGEEHSICLSCGKSNNTMLLYADDNQIITDDNRNWKYECRETPGYGAYMIRDKEGNGQLSVFSEPPSEDEINEILVILSDENVDTETSYLCLWNSEEKQLKVLFGSHAKYADEFDFDEETSSNSGFTNGGDNCEETEPDKITFFLYGQ